MPNFVITLKHELKWLLSPTNIIAVLLILVVSMVGLYKGINDHKAVIDQAKKFQENESVIFNKFDSYYEYRKVGVRVFFVVSATEIFFQNSATIADLFAQVNADILSQIYKNFKGKHVLKKKSASSLRLSNIERFPGTILAMFLGFMAVYRRKYLRSISSITSGAAVFFQLLVSRLIILILDFLFIFASMLVVLKLTNIALSGTDVNGLLKFILVSILMLSVFLGAGFLTGCVRSWRTGLFILVMAWVTINWLIPFIKDSVIDAKADNIESPFNLYAKKLKIVIDFETRSFQEIKKSGMDKNELRKELAERYWSNEYNKIVALEGKYKNDIAEIMQLDRKIAKWCPTTFYQMSCDELSSSGYLSYLEFYSYVQNLHRGFLRFYINKRHIEKAKIIENFIKGNENLYFSESRVPGNFSHGLAITVLWIIVLYLAAFLAFIKTMFPKHKPAGAFKKIDLDLVPGKHMAYKVYDPDFVVQFLNVLAGRIKHYNGQLTINLKNAVTTEKKDYLYLAGPDHVPGDMKVNDYLALFKGLLKVPDESYQKILDGLDKAVLKKRFRKLERHEQALVFLKVAHMKKTGIIVLDNIAAGIPENLLKELIHTVESLRDGGAVVVDFFAAFTFWTNLPDSFSSIVCDGDGMYEEITSRVL
jgi:hypothetical protein